MSVEKLKDALKKKIKVSRYEIDPEVCKKYYYNCSHNTGKVGVALEIVGIIDKCQTPACQAHCPHSAISEFLSSSGDAFSRIDSNLCSECGNCMRNCMYGAVRKDGQLVVMTKERAAKLLLTGALTGLGKDIAGEMMEKIEDLFKK